jgi:hypothetical protein
LQLKRAGWNLKLAGIAFTAFLMVAESAVAARAPKSTVNGSVVNGGQRVMLVIPHGAPATPIKFKTGLFLVKAPHLSGQRPLVFVSKGKRFLMSVNVPVGGRLTLKGVRLKPPGTATSKLNSAAQLASSDGTADADEEDITVDGTLKSVSCGSPPTVTVTTSSGDMTVPFDPTTTEIVDKQSGNMIKACADLVALTGQPVEVEARVNPDGSLFALQITVNPNSNGSDLELNGTISGTNCPSSVTVTPSGGAPVVVHILDSTEFEAQGETNETNGSCENLAVGTQVKIEGVLQPDGSVNANKIETNVDAFEAEGTINSTSCGTTPQSISFTPGGGSSALIVTIGPGTQIGVNGDDSASCTDLTTGPAQVEGMKQPNASIAATQIEQGE